MKHKKRISRKKSSPARQPPSYEAWLTASLHIIVIFSALSAYLFLRRGYVNTYIVNKVFGSTAAILAALSLSAGVLARWKPFLFSHLVRCRRELGLSAWILALLHMATSLLFLGNRFPLSWYQSELIPFFAGSGAVLIWSVLALISHHEQRDSLGTTLWTFLQRSGAQLAFLFILVHLVVMKYQGWIKWSQGLVKANLELAHPEYPPASIFVLLILLSVLILKLVSWLHPRR
ncbi:hypothetical protein HY947_06845 [Candidatus Gottesmanbacteria bacterium]|nr:hypothetical protein [Candidatus Gottesmanbacteria bacterium]